MIVTELPSDVIYHMTSFIDPNDMYAYTEASKIFNTIAKSHENLKKKIKRPKSFHLVKSANLLSWALSHKEYKLNCHLSHCAAMQNCIMMLRYLYKLNCPFKPIVWQCAIRNNNIKMVKWISKQSIPFNPLLLIIAIDYNRVNIFKFLYEYCDKMDLEAQQDNILNYAISKGRVEIVDWLHNEHDYQFCRFTFEYAAESGKIPMLEYIYKLAYNDASYISWWTPNTCVSAAEHGHIHVLKWLREKCCPWDIFTTYAAAEHRQIETLKWCIDNKCPVERGLFNCLEEHYGLIYTQEQVNIYDL